LKVAHAKRGFGQQVQNTQTSAIAETVVNANQVHADIGIYSKRNIARANSSTGDFM
jgi:hypothetical protein